MRPFRILDVFTDRPFAGNPLAVVTDAAGLTARQMQTLARQFNLSETIFVLPPADRAHAAAVRIFLPSAEIAFAGHPIVGCAVHLAETRLPPGADAATLVLGAAAGAVPVRLWRDGGRWTAELTAPVVPRPHPGAADPAQVAAALGLDPAAVGFGAHRPGSFSGGPAFLYVPVADLAALARAAPREPRWSALMAAAGGVTGAFLYTPAGDGALRARFFAPHAGVPEDPATGSAACILAAQLRAAGALPAGTTRIAIDQGVEMGRPARLALTIEATADAIVAVRVAGGAVPVAEGRIATPPEGD